MTTREHKPDGPPPGVGIVGTPAKCEWCELVRPVRQGVRSEVFDRQVEGMLCDDCRDEDIPPRITFLTIARALRQNALNSARIGAEVVKSRLMKRIVERELGEKRQCNLQIMRLPGLITLQCLACDFLAELIPGTDAETKKLVRAAADMHGKEA